MQRPRWRNPCLLLALAASLVLLACPNEPEPPLETVQTPTFSPQGGEYANAQTIYLSCATSGAEIRYTLDGTEPDQTDSLLYTIAGVNVTYDLTLKAKAFKDGMNPSFTGSMSYTILDYPAQVPTPDFISGGVSKPSGVFLSTVQVEPYCDLGPVTFYYTTDGSTPSSSHGTEWTGGYLTVSKRTTLKLIAVYAGPTPVIADSEVKEVFYDVFKPAVSVGSSFSTYQAMSLDADGKHHVVYLTDAGALDPDKLMYATDAGGSWATEEVYSTTFDMVWQWMAIGVASNHDVHVVAMRNVGGGLRHFVRSYADGTWSAPVTVDTTEGTTFVGQYVSMAVKPNDKIYVIYYDATNKNPKYAYFDGSAWHVTTLNSEIYDGEYCSIAADGSNYLHMSWYDDENKDLVYRSGIDDSENPIDTTGDVGKWSSIAVDGNDKVHISYLDETNGNLKYATDASGSWVTETVASTGTTGLYTSIAVSSDGIPCITYYYDRGSSNYDLWYAVKPFAAWLTKEMVVGAPKYAHVVVDGSGYASIVYPGKLIKDGP
jgi:hypothetical protein